MDYLISHSNEEHLSNTFINNVIEEINESHNQEGYNILNNSYLFNPKDMTLFKLIDKKTNEEKEHKNNINYDNDFFHLNGGLNEKKQISSKKIEQNNEPKNEKPIKQKKKCGRKRKNNDNKKEHCKFSDDNLRRKCRHLVLKYTMNFINEKIYNIYNGKIGNGILKKVLKTINNNQKKDSTVAFEQNFLYKKLGDIFSDNITTRFTNISPTFNKRLISTLINEKDEIKKQYFTNLFNITFLECLKHFRGEIIINELKGLICFENLKENIKSKCEEEGDDYVELLEYYINNYEVIVNKKRPRVNKIYK